LDFLLTILLLLLCLLISNVISHYIPFIPTALTQIAFGVVLALVNGDISLELETEWFLLLFVAPLLYNDGRHFPREELWRMRASIFGNAIVLVLLTAVGGGYFIHWMIPEIPLAASFALAAILSPTDPVAVNGIAKRIHIPEQVLNLVRGESLINDASGLVAFDYAVVAVVTGFFSIKEAVFDFTYMFIAGALLGLILGLLIIWIRFILRKQGINDITFHSLLQIMTPFIIFIITEEMLHASGVIAVVVAGIVHSLIHEKTETMNAQEKVLTENIWSIVLFILNGIVFLLLGLNIPSSMIETVENPNIGNWLAMGYVVAVGLMILAIRFAWSYLFSYQEYRFLKKKMDVKPNVKNTLFISLTGVRGAVTMAGVLSIPFVIQNGEAFPHRSLILFLAAGVILFTLIVATVFLPLLSKEEQTAGEEPSVLNLTEAKSRILLAAIQKIKVEMTEENAAVAYELMDEYKRMFAKYKQEQTSNTDAFQKKVREVRLTALRAERQYIQEMMGQGRMDEELFATFEKSLDYREDALSNNVRSGILFIIGRSKRAWLRFLGQNRQETRLAELRVLGRDIQIKTLQNAVKKLEEYSRQSEMDQTEVLSIVIADYNRLIRRLKRPTVHYNEKSEEQKEELRIKVMDIERSEIHRMYEAGDINKEQAKELRRFINYIESVTLYEHVE